MSAFKQRLARIGASAGVLAVSMAAILAVSGVSASAASAACTGTTELNGAGSSLQKVAQTEIWIPQWETNTCSAEVAPQPKYESTSSGKGLAQWGFTTTLTEVNKKLQFIGTDDGPKASQITSARSAANNANVVVVPVAQTAIAVMVHPPASCTITKISNKHLEEAFSGKATTWTGIGASGTGCSGALKRVVRTEGSGTTYQFKNYLSLVNTGAPCATSTTKWSELEEIGTNEEPNINWPECGSGVPLRGAGGGALAEKVVATSGSIGYAALPDAKAKGATVIEVQDGTEEGEEKFAKPGVEETEEGKKGFANCAKAKYEVPAEARETGTGLNADWSKVFGGKPTILGGTYPICTLTYDLGWSSYATAGYTGGATIGGWVEKYVTSIIKLGGTTTVPKWYAALPSPAAVANNVKAAAIWSAEKIK